MCFSSTKRNVDDLGKNKNEQWKWQKPKSLNPIQLDKWDDAFFFKWEKAFNYKLLAESLAGIGWCFSHAFC